MFSFLYSKSSHKLFCIFIRHYLVCVLSRFPCGDCRGQYPIHRHTHLRIDTHTDTHTAWTPINLSCCVSFWSSVASHWVCVHVPHACTYMPVCALYVEAGVIWGDLYSVHTHEEREGEMERVGHMSLDCLLTQFHSEERELKEKQQERDSVSVLCSEEISILLYKFTAGWESSL